MNRFATIDPLEAVVGAFVNAQKTTGRAATRVVVDREDLAIGANHDAERIPETLGDAAELGAIRLAGEDAPFSATREFNAIGSGEHPIFAEVLTEGEDQIAGRCPRQAREAVVRVVRDRRQRDHVLFLVGDAVAIRILDAEDAVTLRKIDPAVLAQLQVHRLVRLRVEDPTVLPVLVEDKDFVVDRADVSRWAEVGVAGDRPEVALRVDVEARRRGEIRVFDEKGEFQSRFQEFDFRRQVRRDNRGFHRICGHRQGSEEKEEWAHDWVGYP